MKDLLMHEVAPRPRVSRVFATTLALFVLVGCQDERVSPSPASGSASGGAGAGGAGGAGGEGAGGSTPGPRIREVFLRNPMGSPPDNLFVDGDFELSIVPEESSGGQYGWIAFTSGGSPATLLGETGGLCRSGLRCGRVRSGRLLFGRGAAAPDEADMRASIWVKPLEPADDPEKPCDVGTFVAVACDSFQQLRVLQDADAPDAKGWCEMAGDIDGATQSVCLYVEAEVDMLIDAATLLPRATGDDVSPLPPPHEHRLSAEQHARMSNLRDVLRRRMPFGKALPEPDR